MIGYRDLIYYKQDIIKEYFSKRKGVKEEEIEDLLRCSLLFLEQSVKNSNTPFIIPNIGILHKKIDLGKLNKMTSTVEEEDNLLVESAYLNTKFSPIITRKTMLEQYYPEVELSYIQEIQNSK